MSSSDAEAPPGLDLYANRGPYLFWVCVAVIVLSTLVVGLRFSSRKMAGLPFLLDDWTILVALPCVLFPCILELYCTKVVGFGKHVEALGASSDTDVKNFWFHLWISNIFYSMATALIKVSVLLYLRQTFQFRDFAIYAQIIGGMVLLWGFATILTTIFSCHPIEGFWDQRIPHQCIDNFKFALGMNLPNILFDIAIIALPLCWLWRIHNSVAQKVALGFVYAMAGFVVALGALRLQSVVEYAASDDFTWDFIPIAILTALETSSALICACLPTLNPLLQFCLRGSAASTPSIRNRPIHVIQHPWPSKQKDLTMEEAGELARITGGEAPKPYYHEMSASEVMGDITEKKNEWPEHGGASDGIQNVQERAFALGGPEPPKRVKRGWATPKESRFSDW